MIRSLFEVNWKYGENKYFIGRYRYTDHEREECIGTFTTYKKALAAVEEVIKRSGRDYHKISSIYWQCLNAGTGKMNYIDERGESTEVYDCITITEKKQRIDEILFDKLY